MSVALTMALVAVQGCALAAAAGPLETLGADCHPHTGTYSYRLSMLSGTDCHIATDSSVVTRTDSHDRLSDSMCTLDRHLSGSGLTWDSHTTWDEYWSHGHTTWHVYADDGHCDATYEGSADAL